MSRIVLLEQENTELKRKLKVSQIWMEKEVRESAHKIATRRVGKMTVDEKTDFLTQNQEEIITNRIRGYFGELLLLNAPKNTVEYLVDAEISYFTLMKIATGDGVGVISSFTKILDALIETIITAQFRKYVLKQGPVILRANDPLEKALYLVISKKYTLSTGRLYALIRGIRNNEKQLEFASDFTRYLEKYSTLGTLLTSDEFFLPYRDLIEGEVFGGKRHSGRITGEETKKIREILVGEYTHKTGLIYQLLSHSAIAY